MTNTTTTHETATKATAEERKQEALKRLHMLNLHPNVLRDFKQGTLNCSDRIEFGPLSKFGPSTIGALFWLSDEEQEKVKEIEKKYEITVYHMTYEETAFGELYDLFYVSSHKDEWERDRQELKAGYPCVYTVNVDDPLCSEFGAIGIRSVGGALIRTE